MSTASDWTEKDHRECLQLMRKAQGCGVLTNLYECVRHDNDWSLIPSTAGEGSMSDAAKRQRNEDASAEQISAPPVMAHPAPSTSAYACQAVAAAVPPPMVGTGAVLDTSSKLPPGVPTLAAWGRTKVSFGKFMNKRTYLSLHQSNSDEDRSYKKWLAAHATNGSPHLKDLVNYLMCMGDSAMVGCHDGSQTVLIPGTDVPRVMG